MSPIYLIENILWLKISHVTQSDKNFRDDNSLGKCSKINTTWSKDDPNRTIEKGHLSMESQ